MSEHERDKFWPNREWLLDLYRRIIDDSHEVPIREADRVERGRVGGGS